MKYGVVVVTYNRCNLLKECMNAILTQSRSFDEIIIVDNCSTDGTLTYLDTLRMIDKIHVFRLKSNKGGSFGFATGLKFAMNYEIDWCLLIDDDAIIQDDFNKTIADYIEKDKNRQKAYSCTVLTNDSIYTRHRTRHVSKKLMLLKNVPLEEYSKESFDCESATFCGLVVDMNLAQKIGFPKADYFIWEDDAEYCERLRKYTSIRNVNKAILNHKTGGDFDAFSWKAFYGARNLVDIAKTHYGIGNTILCVLRVSLRGLKYIIKGGNDSYNRWGILLMYIRAITCGLRGHLGIDYRYYPKKSK